MSVLPTPVEPEEKPAERPGINFSTLDWHKVDLNKGIAYLADLQRLWEHASKVLQQRQQAKAIVSCHCGCKRRFLPAQACMSMALRNPKTLLPYNVYFATQECVRQFRRKQMGLAEDAEALPR